MQRNFDKPFLDLRGSTVPSEIAGQPITLAVIATNALSTTLPTDESLSGKERIDLISLAVRITEGGVREYSVAELATILRRTEKTSSHLGLYRMDELINTPEAE